MRARRIAFLVICTLLAATTVFAFLCYQAFSPSWKDDAVIGIFGISIIILLCVQFPPHRFWWIASIVTLIVDRISADATGEYLNRFSSNHFLALNRLVRPVGLLVVSLLSFGLALTNILSACEVFESLPRSLRGRPMAAALFRFIQILTPSYIAAAENGRLLRSWSGHLSASELRRWILNRCVMPYGPVAWMCNRLLFGRIGERLIMLVESTRGSSADGAEARVVAKSTLDVAIYRVGFNLDRSLPINVNFSLRSGELLLLRGPPRSGKSSCLRAISGVLRTIQGGNLVGSVIPLSGKGHVFVGLCGITTTCRIHSSHCG